MKTKKNPELSCIIITLNEEKHLPHLLNSLKRQTYTDFEMIVADFNSKDNTRKIARKYGCKIVSGGRHSVARNSGAKAAKGKYFLFLDADSILEKNFIKEGMKELKKSGAGVASVFVKPLNGKAIDKILFSMYNLWARTMTRVSPHGTGSCIFIKRGVFNAIKGFDEKIIFAEDHNLLKRAKKYGFILLPLKINTSVRRMEKEGRARLAFMYIYAGVYRMFYKEIEKELFEYD